MVNSTNGRNTQVKTGFRNTNRDWLISSAPKLASEVRLISARLRSAYRAFSSSLGGWGRPSPDRRGRPRLWARSAVTMASRGGQGFVSPDRVLADVRRLDRDDPVVAGGAHGGDDLAVGLGGGGEAADDQREVMVLDGGPGGGGPGERLTRARWPVIEGKGSRPAGRIHGAAEVIGRD